MKTTEPVAWMQVHYKDHRPTKFSKVQTWEDDIPLYTHQYERPYNTVLVPCDRLAEMQAEIEALKAKLNKYHLKEDLDRNLNLIYGKEFIK